MLVVLPDNKIEYLYELSCLTINGSPVHLSFQQQEHKKNCYILQIVVTILSGIPGSYQNNMADVLSNLSKEQNR